MKKVIIQGFRTPKMESNNPTIRNLENQEIIDYVNSIHEAEEIFIFAHGSEYQLKENLSIMFKVSLYNINNNKYEKEDLNNEFVQNLLTNFNKNTTNNLPNIFHFYSCHSGAIHNYLSEVKGSLVLCTYIPSDGIALNRVNEILYNRSIESINLIDFIVKNLPLLAAVGFNVPLRG